uniref:Uncharacterized protein n=1 Tax=Anguilla anguilla TaxID=7936 RepID=A0A0E9VWI5_ANGAN
MGVGPSLKIAITHALHFTILPTILCVIYRHGT